MILTSSTQWAKLSVIGALASILYHVFADPGPSEPPLAAVAEDPAVLLRESQVLEFAEFELFSV